MAKTVPSYFGARTDTGLTVAKIVEALRLNGRSHTLYVSEQGQWALQYQVKPEDDPEWKQGYLSRFRGITISTDTNIKGYALLCNNRVGPEEVVRIICKEAEE